MYRKFAIVVAILGLLVTQLYGFQRRVLFEEFMTEW